MGANTRSQQSNRTYWYIYQGRLRRKVSEAEAVDTNGKLLNTYFSRVNKKNVKIYEQEAGDIDGQAIELEYKEGNFGPEIAITLKDGEEVNTISFQAVRQDGETFGDYASTFSDQIGLISFENPIKIVPYSFSPQDKPDKTYSGVSIQSFDGSDWVKVKEHPKFAEYIKKKPKAEEKPKIGGGTKWDFTKPTEWSYGKLMAAIDRLTKKLNEAQPEPEPKEESPVEEDITDDLPF